MENLLVSSPCRANLPIAFAQLSCAINIAALQTDVDLLLQQARGTNARGTNARGTQATQWIDHVNTNDYSGGWDVMPLRCQRQHLQAHPVLQGFAIAEGSDWENLPALDGCLEIPRLFNQLQCPLKSARLMRLHAGAEVKPHRDHQLSMEYGEARLHLPIHTSDAVHFLVDKKPIPMRAGELWYFNADLIHEVYNRGSEDRINLVLDCVVNDWLREQIQRGAAHE